MSCPDASWRGRQVKNLYHTNNGQRVQPCINYLWSTFWDFYNSELITFLYLATDNVISNTYLTICSSFQLDRGCQRNLLIYFYKETIFWNCRCDFESRRSVRREPVLPIITTNVNNSLYVCSIVVSENNNLLSKYCTLICSTAMLLLWKGPLLKILWEFILWWYWQYIVAFWLGVTSLDDTRNRFCNKRHMVHFVN